MKHKSLFITISLVLGILILALSVPAVAGDNHKAPLRGVIYDYAILMHLGVLDDDGRLLVWKSSIKGDIDGYMLWWFDQPMKTPLNHEDFVVMFYSCRWEIFDSDPLPPDGSGGLGSNPDAKLLLAGISAGETLIPSDPAGSDGIWDGSGIVMEASEDYKQWKHCIMNENGPVVFSVPTGSPGKIRIFPHGLHPRDFFKKSASDASEEKNIPEKLGFLKNYPNPFNPSTTIEFDLAEVTEVRIDIYNNAGQKVETLLNKSMQAGNHKIEWDGSGMASGIYYYKIQVSGFQDVKRMILVK